MWMLTLKRHPGLPGPPIRRLFVNVIFCTLQLTCSCHCCWPSSFLPCRVSSKRAQGFSNNIDILDIYPACLLPKAGTAFEINIAVIIFPRNFCLLFNLLSPKSDKHEISLYNINCFRKQNGHENWVHGSARADESSWYFNKFFPLLLFKEYRGSKWESPFWY